VPLWQKLLASFDASDRRSLEVGSILDLRLLRFMLAFQPCLGAEISI